MTVSTSTSRSGPYAGNGSATSFNYNFKVLDEAHLAVYLTDSSGIDTLQTLATHYTVSGVGDASGSITMVTPPASGETITIVRDVPFDQQTEYENQGALLLEVVERGLDKLTMSVQQLQEELDRSVKVAVSSTDDPDDLVSSVVSSAAAASSSASAAAASAASAATDAASVDGDEIAANHQAAALQADIQFPVMHQALQVAPHHRNSIVFSPSAAERHIYRTVDAGAVHINSSTTNVQWFDLRHLGVGQIFIAHCRAGGSTARVVIDPGESSLASAYTFRGLSAGQKIVIYPGETIAIAAGSTGIFEVVYYEKTPRTAQNSSISLLVENQFGYYDGHQIVNAVNGFNGVTLPSGYMFNTDTNFRSWSYPDLQMAVNAAAGADVPRIQIPDREYTISSLSGSFQIGETVNASGGGVLRVDYLCNDTTKIGLDLQSSPVPVATETLTGATSGATATVDSVASIGDLGVGATAFMVHNPSGLNIDLRVRYSNLEKI